MIDDSPLDGSPTDLDLTPRQPTEPGGTKRGGRSIRNIVILAGFLLVLGFVLFQALSSARVYFYNVDEAIERRAELDEVTFRMQGTVVTEETVDPDGALLFTVAFGDERADVRHVGDEPSGLFDLGERVVVEGRWEGDVFRSHQILVKHSEEYVEANPDRVDYELDAEPVD